MGGDSPDILCPLNEPRGDPEHLCTLRGVRVKGEAGRDTVLTIVHLASTTFASRCTVYLPIKIGNALPRTYLARSLRLRSVFSAVLAVACRLRSDRGCPRLVYFHHAVPETRRHHDLHVQVAYRQGGVEEIFAENVVEMRRGEHFGAACTAGEKID